MNRTRLLVVWIALGLLPLEAKAQLVRYSFTGLVTGVTGVPFSGIDPQAGDPITGHFAYDLSSPDDAPLLPAVSRHLHLPPSIVAVKLRGVTFSSDGDFYTHVQDNYSAGVDVISIGDGGLIAGNDGDTILVNGIPDYGTVYIDLGDATGTAWDSDALPAKLNPAIFPSMVGYLGVLVENGVIDIATGASFTIHTLTAIPEPATASLPAAGSLILLSGRRQSCRVGIKKRPN